MYISDFHFAKYAMPIVPKPSVKTIMLPPSADPSAMLKDLESTAITTNTVSGRLDRNPRITPPVIPCPSAGSSFSTPIDVSSAETANTKTAAIISIKNENIEIQPVIAGKGIYIRHGYIVRKIMAKSWHMAAFFLVAIIMAYIAIILPGYNAKSSAPISTTTIKQQNPIISAPPQPAQNSTKIRITVYENDFSIFPKIINVTSGSNVYLDVVNRGVVDNTFNISGNGFAYSIKHALLPGQNSTLEFTAPAPGNYSIFSSIPGRKELGMNATLYVSQS
jgi:hypothetical protein